MALLATYSVIEDLGDPARTLQKFLVGYGTVTSHRVIRIKLAGGGTAMAMDIATKAKDTTATGRIVVVGLHIYTFVGSTPSSE
jgi:hypothetical protein